MNELKHRPTKKERKSSKKDTKIKNNKQKTKKSFFKAPIGVWIYRGLVTIFLVTVLSIGWVFFSLFMEIKKTDELPATTYQTEVYAEYAADTAEDSQERAEMVAKSFVSDFYTWQYKESRGQVQGTQFLYQGQPFLSDFLKYASQTFYSQLDHAANEFGAENLPAVSNVTITNTTNTGEYYDSYYDLTFANSYEVEMTVEYEIPESRDSETIKELYQFPTTVTTTMVWDGTDYYVIGVK